MFVHTFVRECVCVLSWLFVCVIVMCVRVCVCRLAGRSLSFSLSLSLSLLVSVCRCARVCARLRLVALLPARACVCGVRLVGCGVDVCVSSCAAVFVGPCALCGCVVVRVVKLRWVGVRVVCVCAV